MQHSPTTKGAWRIALATTLVLLTTGLSAQLTVTLTGSMHNGSGVPCFGMKEGTVTSTVTGGTAPYIYSWTNGAATAAISGVAAGYYKLKVQDATEAWAEAEITLTEPEPLAVNATAYTYPSGMNISCFDCYNGSIDVEVEKGTPPYTYSWDDGPAITQDRTGLGAKQYTVLVTDANGCEEKGVANLEQPERSDWTMTGNAGTNPATQYIGTSDNKDVVFKANGQEALRLKGDGGISLLGNLLGEGVLMRDTDGKVRLAGDDVGIETLQGCRSIREFPFWQTRGNSFTTMCPEEVPKLGTLADLPLRIITHGQQRMIVSRTGKVGIGTEPPTGEVTGYRLFVEDGIVCRDVLVKEGTWPDFVFDPCYTPMPLDELRSYLNAERHLPGIPSAAELAENNGVQLGDMQRRLVQVVEEQALYILQLEERLQAVEQRLDAAKTTK